MERTLICSVQLSKTGAPTDRELELLRIHVSTSSGVALSACDVKNLSIHAKLTNIVLRLLRVLVPPPLICHRLLARAIQLSILKLRRLKRRRRRGDPGYYRKVRGVSKGLRIGPCDQGSASDEESTTAPPSDVTTPPATTTPTTTMPTTTTVPGRKSL